jgi:2-succinyl-5-enolpyruvyl-6-hydroxy-3-cyclohexene-1-carboxylate synthase
VTTQPGTLFCEALVDAFFANGVRHAAVSPGSRNTPLLLALGAHSGIDVTVHHDERSGGFFALGLARASGRPVLLSCTSGTAATEYLPAVTEARMSQIPLIVLTADRPPELQDRGAPQTINQTNLYGAATKYFHNPGVPTAEAISYAAQTAVNAVAIAVESPAGPAHLNIPLREPLVPESRHPGPRPELSTQPVDPTADLTFPETELVKIAEMVGGRRLAIVAGPTSSAGAGPAIAELARAAEAIVIADPQSQIRFDGQAESPVIHSADLLLATGQSPRPSPEVILHIGGIHTSKPVNQWLQRLGAPLIQIHDSPWLDPLDIAERAFHADPGPLVRRLAESVEPGPADMAAAWRTADHGAQGAIDRGLTGLSEPAIARRLTAALPAGAALVAASSMPIRLIDSYGGRRTEPLRVIANRGANGIDGTIATALGVAAAGIGPTYALLGDLSALADIGSLATARRLQLPITFIVINNDGGGIFEYLPQADPQRVDPELFQKLIVAPHGYSLSPIAAAFGIDTAVVTDLEGLAAIATAPPAGPRLVEVHTRRHEGPRVRAAAIAGVAAAAGLG